MCLCYQIIWQRIWTLCSLHSRLRSLFLVLGFLLIGFLWGAGGREAQKVKHLDLPITTSTHSMSLRVDGWGAGSLPALGGHRQRLSLIRFRVQGKILQGKANLVLLTVLKRVFVDILLLFAASDPLVKRFFFFSLSICRIDQTCFS